MFSRKPGRPVRVVSMLLPALLVTGTLVQARGASAHATGRLGAGYPYPPAPGVRAAPVVGAGLRSPALAHASAVFTWVIGMPGAGRVRVSSVELSGCWSGMQVARASARTLAGVPLAIARRGGAVTVDAARPGALPLIVSVTFKTPLVSRAAGTRLRLVAGGRARVVTTVTMGGPVCAASRTTPASTRRAGPVSSRGAPATTTTVIALNCGGGAAAPFVADKDYHGGVAYGATRAVATTGVTNPAPRAVYQSERHGATFSYVVPRLRPGAPYTVRLHFAEIYWTAAGKRVFNVAINGRRVLTRFDIYAAARGAYRAIVKPFAATATAGGTITIGYTRVVDDAASSGIDILSAAPAPPPTATRTAIPAATATRTRIPATAPAMTATITPRPTATPTATATATAMNTPVATATNTNTPVATATNTPAATPTTAPTATDGAVSPATSSPAPTRTPTSIEPTRAVAATATPTINLPTAIPASPTVSASATAPTVTSDATATAMGAATAGMPTATSSPAPPTVTATAPPATPFAVSADPFAAPVPGQHRSEVEPDTFAYGDTLVSAFQVGRFNDGGSTSIGWATRRGGVWRHGLLPGVTTNDSPAGPYDRVSDPSVAYDAAHGVWLVSSLAILDTSDGAIGKAVVVNRSADGVDWTGSATPYTATVSATGPDFYDKEWIVCDNTAASPYYGHCYAEWDDASLGDQLMMSTSTDGGQTWGAPVVPAGAPSGLGGQPVAQPGGVVVVPFESGYGDAIKAFTSRDGGATWGNVTTVGPTSDHPVAGGLRSEALPSAEVDGAGTVYVAWQSCAFEANCATNPMSSTNDIVFSRSSDGATWSQVARVPIDPVGGPVDHFTPGIAVDRGTSGATARLGLTYYSYPNAACDASTCQLEVGFVSSINGGTTWSAPRRLAGPISLGWLPATTLGPMVGDYISTSFVPDGAGSPVAVAVFAVAGAPNNGVLDESMYAARLDITGGSLPASAFGAGTSAAGATLRDHGRRTQPSLRRGYW